MDLSKRSLVDKSLYECCLVVIIHFLIPIFDIGLPIYIWYEYETQNGIRMTYDYYWPVSAAFIFFAIAKFLFYAWNAFVLCKTMIDETFISKYRIWYQLTMCGASKGIIPLLFVDGCQELVRYFFYVRFTMKTVPVPWSVYLGVFYQLIKYFEIILWVFYFVKRQMEKSNLRKKYFRRVTEDKFQKASELAYSLEDYVDSTAEEPLHKNYIIQASFDRNLFKQPFYYLTSLT